MLSRAQVLARGLTRAIMLSEAEAGQLAANLPRRLCGLFGCTQPRSTLWAAVLYAGPGAMLSHQTAAELWGLADKPSSLIHLTIPGDRRVRKQPG